MHEMGLAVEIRRLAREAVADRGPGRLEIVRVAVGELSAVEPDLLEFAWEAAVAGTEDAASKLEVDFRPARQTCRVCGEIRDRVPGSWLRLCPRCGDALTVSGGDDLDVLRVVFEETVPAGGARP
ncbi:MAG TPA: hydrogenase maturation nickel metallochaperone HypA [Thermoanaerobaculia bacterium]|nr:hydrogenase maturation nickel metallochaperone HypA [Thermoanaerobaculia bacterium]